MFRARFEEERISVAQCFIPCRIVVFVPYLSVTNSGESVATDLCLSQETDCLSADLPKSVLHGAWRNGSGEDLPQRCVALSGGHALQHGCDEFTVQGFLDAVVERHYGVEVS